MTNAQGASSSTSRPLVIGHWEFVIHWALVIIMGKEQLTKACPTSGEFGSFVANFVANFVDFRPFSTKFSTKFATKDFLGLMAPPAGGAGAGGGDRDCA